MMITSALKVTRPFLVTFPVTKHSERTLLHRVRVRARARVRVRVQESMRGMLCCVSWARQVESHRQNTISFFFSSNPTESNSNNTSSPPAPHPRPRPPPPTTHFQEEVRVIRKEAKLLEQKTKEPNINPRVMKEYLVRMLYCEMLGHEASFGYETLSHRLLVDTLVRGRH